MELLEAESGILNFEIQNILPSEKREELPQQ